MAARACDGLFRGDSLCTRRGRSSRGALGLAVVPLPVQALIRLRLLTPAFCAAADSGVLILRTSGILLSEYSAHEVSKARCPGEWERSPFENVGQRVPVYVDAHDLPENGSVSAE